ATGYKRIKCSSSILKLSSYQDALAHGPRQTAFCGPSAQRPFHRPQEQEASSLCGDFTQLS
ncbi:hypothetical protein WDW37_11730, partial [Bdellovibrionota bacterium FG-1]